MGSEEVPAGPLSGIRVLDFSMFMAGPYCTRLMADAGAEVIKIEPPDGDYLRGANPMRGPHSGFFAHMSCGKKSVKLDLKSAAGKAAIRRLMPTIDVVLENYRPGVMDRLELGYEALSALQPKLVFCSVSGYGQTGPDAKLPAYAPIIHAASGMDLALIEFERRLDRPIANRSTAADILAATHAFGAICAALVGRARTGKGERIDVALMDTMHHMLAYEVQAAQLENPPKPPVFEPIETRDGFIVVAPVSLLNFQSLARAIG
ncbi:MAG: CoA transferase, partial [Alphaproteobacteria bacterium]|nr:CoA transferase [Alphaproteobacteria bacterium]